MGPDGLSRRDPPFELCGSLGAALTTGGGITFTSIFELSSIGTYCPQVENLDFVETDGMQLTFYYTGNTIAIATWAIDDVLLTDLDYTQVELIAFRGDVNDCKVLLNWLTSTETNNKGFEVQKKFGNEFQTIAFVEGNGTSTQQHSYSYTDKNVVSGNYSCRLRQVDFDGNSEYSQVVEVTVVRPVEYNPAQNYPNPFNPSTKINHGLKADSKVTLKVFDILGQEVVTLLNQNMTAGNHTATFDASKLNSGVYLYKIEATGGDGSSFNSLKKMILTK